MTAIASAADAAYSSDDEFHATAFWTFVHLNPSRFASTDVRDVVREFAPRLGEGVNAFAKRLRTDLVSHGGFLKHTHALGAASKLARYKAWYVGSSAAAKKQLERVVHGPRINRYLDGWYDAVEVISNYPQLPNLGTRNTFAGALNKGEEEAK